MSGSRRISLRDVARTAVPVRAFLFLSCLVVLCGAFPTHKARAQSYPTKTVTIVSPFAPGSISDAAARLVAQYLQERLGQSFVVESKVGGNGLLAASIVARAPPDGYTLLLTVSSSHASPALYKSMPYDPVKDFTHIARMGSFPSFLAANNDQPFKTIQELVSFARAHPGKVTYAHGNNFGRVVMETLKHRLNLDILRVAYRSNPAATTDLIGGQISLSVPDMATGLAQTQAKQIRALATFTKDRTPFLPDTPTMNETVMPNFELLPWCGFSGPANLPPEVVAILAREVKGALAQPQTRQRFSDAGIDPFYADSAEFSRYMMQEIANWNGIVKEAGIEPQ